MEDSRNMMANKITAASAGRRSQFCSRGLRFVPCAFRFSRLNSFAMHYRIITLLGLLLLATVGSAADTPRSVEPSVDGKRMSVWLEEYQRSIPKPEYLGD